MVKQKGRLQIHFSVQWVYVYLFIFVGVTCMYEFFFLCITWIFYMHMYYIYSQEKKLFLKHLFIPQARIFIGEAPIVCWAGAGPAADIRVSCVAPASGSQLPSLA